MSKISIHRLRHFIAGFPASPPRTKALEQSIKIGTGFHNEWYRSQQEHWLGWLALKTIESENKGKLRTSSQIWSTLKCSPMMFWMSEVVGTDPGVLSELEQITISISGQHPQDGNPHGVAFRKLLPWSRIEAALSRLSPALSIEDSENKKARGTHATCRADPKVQASPARKPLGTRS